MTIIMTFVLEPNSIRRIGDYAVNFLKGSYDFPAISMI